MQIAHLSKLVKGRDQVFYYFVILMKRYRRGCEVSYYLIAKVNNIFGNERLGFESLARNLASKRG